MQTPPLACMELIFGDVSGAKLAPWLAEMRAIGFDGVALRATTLEPYFDAPEAFAKLLAQNNLKLAGAYAQLSSPAAFIERVCKFITAQDCDNLCLHGAKRGAEEERLAALALMQKHGATAHRLGVAATFHHHTHTPFETFAETETLLQETNPAHVHLFCDTGHAHLDFVDLPEARRSTEFLTKYWPRVKYVEFKDCSPATGLSTELGQGSVDFAAIASLLCERNYAGWITLEQNSPTKGSSPSECAARSLQFARKVFSRCTSDVSSEV
jgi:sugar phosphate isomerase/epimerase